MGMRQCSNAVLKVIDRRVVSFLLTEVITNDLTLVKVTLFAPFHRNLTRIHATRTCRKANNEALSLLSLTANQTFTGLPASQ